MLSRKVHSLAKNSHRMFSHVQYTGELNDAIRNGLPKESLERIAKNYKTDSRYKASWSQLYMDAADLAKNVKRTDIAEILEQEIAKVTTLLSPK